MRQEDIIEVIQKAMISTGAAAGISSPQDAGEFIDLSTEQNAVLSVIRVEKDIRTELNLDTLSLGEPVIVAGTEGAAPAADDVVAPQRERKTLRPREVVAAFDVPYSFLRKNIEGDRVNDSLNRLFAKRFGKDVCLVSFMGDTAKAADSRTNKALRIFDGFVKQALGDATAHDYVIPANPNYNGVVFGGMLDQLPKDYRDDRETLAYFVSADVYDAYAKEIGSRATALGDMILAGPWGKSLSYLGIDLVPVFGLDTGRIVLTPKQNLAVGFGQQITTGVDWDNRQRLMKVTMTADVDAKYIVGDALVLGATA